MQHIELICSETKMKTQNPELCQNYGQKRRMKSQERQTAKTGSQFFSTNNGFWSPVTLSALVGRKYLIYTVVINLNDDNYRTLIVYI